MACNVKFKIKGFKSLDGEYCSDTIHYKESLNISCEEVFTREEQEEMADYPQPLSNFKDLYSFQIEELLKAGYSIEIYPSNNLII